VLKMHHQINATGYPVNIKRIRRLLRLMGLFAIYQKFNTSIPNPEQLYLSLFVAGFRNCLSQSGMVNQHHVYNYGSRFSVSGSHY